MHFLVYVFIENMNCFFLECRMMLLYLHVISLVCGVSHCTTNCFCCSPKTSFFHWSSNMIFSTTDKVCPAPVPVSVHDQEVELCFSFRVQYFGTGTNFICCKCPYTLKHSKHCMAHVGKQTWKVEFFVTLQTVEGCWEGVFTANLDSPGLLRLQTNTKTQTTSHNGQFYIDHLGSPKLFICVVYSLLFMCTFLLHTICLVVFHHHDFIVLYFIVLNNETIYITLTFLSFYHLLSALHPWFHCTLDVQWQLSPILF